jgi:hypothetical protein
MSEIALLRCDCGSLRGEIHGLSPSNCNRCICYCTDCRAFARFLGKEESVLDGLGGTEIVQLSPARIRLTRGEEHLAAIRLSPRGPVRWFAGCCMSPLGNTVEGGRLPFAGMIRPTLQPPPGTEANAVFGPVRGTVYGRHALGNSSEAGLHPGIPKRMALRLLRLILGWKLQGAARKSPLHYRQDVQPELLDLDTLNALKQADRDHD